MQVDSFIIYNTSVKKIYNIIISYTEFKLHKPSSHEFHFNTYHLYRVSKHKTKPDCTEEIVTDKSITNYLLPIV